MYIMDDIAYADDKAVLLHVVGVRIMDDYMLWVRFDNGETRIFDCKPLLKLEAFAPLSDTEVFKGAYIDCGVVTWQEGEIDLAPEYLYQAGKKEEVA